MLAVSGFTALVPTRLLSERPAAARVDDGSSKTLRVWVFSDAHVGRDK
jgi:hypothetical protein